MSLYEYSPLSNPEEIRLLILHSGKGAGIVECALHHESLSNSGPYEALSYTWGSDVLQPILLNQHVFHVRANLASALKHLRRKDSSRVLWVDALCINQADVEERNLQVMRMGAIYQKAFSVCAWLGPEEDNSDEAIGLLKQMRTSSGCNYMLQNLGIKGNNNDFSFPRWQALSLLMARPWFRRRWVIQEVAFAAEVVLQCGNSTVTWSEFSCAVNFLGSHGRDIAKKLESVPMQGPSTPAKINRSGDLTAQGASRLLTSSEAICKNATSGIVQRLRTLHDLISLFPDFEASDRRDVIYALIPLAKDVFNSKEWLPDYSKHWLEVWKQYVAYVVRETGSLDVICQPWAPPSVGTPLWISTSLLRRTAKPGALVRPGQKGGGFLFIDGVNSLKYRAGGDSRAKFRISGNTLFAIGIWVDKIAVAGEIAHQGMIPMDWRAMAIKNAQLQRSQPNPQYNLMPHEFCDTLVAGRSSSGEPPPQSFRRACDQFFGPTAHEDFVNTISKAKGSQNPENPDAAEFLHRARSSTWNRKFVVTKERRMGLVNPRAQPNDVICILLGCSVPIVLRQEGTGFILIGESYVNGLMNGETMRSVETGSYTLQEFQII
jgi:hypothetical protein